MEQSYYQPTRASKAKAKSISDQSKQTSPSRASQPTYSVPSTASASRTVGITTDASTFRDLILTPRRISINKMPLSQSAFQHFKTIHSIRYQDIPGLASTSVWLEANDHFKSNIVMQYKEMKEWGLCEAEAWRTKRMIQLVAKPQCDWNPPPVLDTPPIRDYNFDIRPDASYWIPIEIFNDQYINLVQQLAFVKYKKILCPYLSIEFKKDDSKAQKAESQVAVAGSMALYNRFKLKEKRLQKQQKSWSEKRLTDVRHYGITFMAEMFTVWCIRPNAPLDINDDTLDTWAGCIMELVHTNSCDTMHGAENLIEWINEIHRWGLTRHGGSCQQDIQRCIEAEGVLRTSLGDAQELQDSD